MQATASDCSRGHGKCLRSFSCGSAWRCSPSCFPQGSRSFRVIDAMADPPAAERASASCPQPSRSAAAPDRRVPVQKWPGPQRGCLACRKSGKRYRAALPVRACRSFAFSGHISSNTVRGRSRPWENEASRRRERTGGLILSIFGKHEDFPARALHLRAHPKGGGPEGY